MARQIRALALVLFLVIVGLASASAHAPDASKVAAAPKAAASAPSDDTVGSLDGDTDAAPVGGPVPDGVFTPTPINAAAPAPGQSGATALEVSAVAGVSAAVAAVFF